MLIDAKKNSVGVSGPRDSATVEMCVFKSFEQWTLPSPTYPYDGSRGINAGSVLYNDCIVTDAQLEALNIEMCTALHTRISELVIYPRHRRSTSCAIAAPRMAARNFALIKTRAGPLMDQASAGLTGAGAPGCSPEARLARLTAAETCRTMRCPTCFSSRRERRSSSARRCKPASQPPPETRASTPCPSLP